MRYDAIVIGGGPAGCAAALTLARAGARVVVLESSPEPTRRFAGEWIHPAGVAVLRRLGIELTQVPHAIGRGFVDYPRGTAKPVVTSYPPGALAWVCEHGTLVTALRSAAEAHPHTEFFRRARATAVDGTEVLYLDQDGNRRTVHAPLIVGADGKSSLVRRLLGPGPPSTALSHMAGLLLHDVELPFEGYGHVLLGGPGPVMIYRVSPRRVRVCIDIPTAHAHQATINAYLAHHYDGLFPLSLRRGLRAALEEQTPQWAANRTSPRTAYGRDGYALVGDATGFFHPLTASGIALALADAECLARAASIGAYARERARQTRTTELVANGLYGVMSAHGPAAQIISNSLFDVLRRNPAERVRAIRLLSGEEQRMRNLWRLYLRVVANAVLGSAHGPGPRDWRRTAATCADFAAWLRWLAGTTTRRSAGGRHMPK